MTLCSQTYVLKYMMVFKPKNTVALIMLMYDSSWVLDNFMIIIMVKNGLY